jgi:hypothetical protein
MKLKFKLVSAACVALCSAGAFAATSATVCAPSTLAGLINTCAPEVTFYVGGASAQAGALNAVLAAGAGIFDTSAVRGKITDTSTAISGNGNTVAYIGIGAAATPYVGKRVLVIYNKANGSAAGVNQLLTGKGGALEEVTLVTSTVKNLAKGVAGSCVAVEPATAGALGTASCATELAFKSAWGVDAQKSMHLALSDVRPSELTPGIVKKWDATKFPSVTTAVQGFGVMVNPALYTALITKEIAAGHLDATCATSQTVGGATDVITAACQPNLDKALYASVITGKVTTADALLGTSGNTNALNLARRVSTSGSQAASNIYFAGQPGYAVKTPTVDGFADLLAAGTATGVVVTEGAATGDVITAVSGNTTGYAMGVVSIENFYTTTKATSKLKGGLFVKLEGVSPNFSSAGALDAKHRAGLLNGYPFAFEMQAIKPTALAGNYLDIADKIVTALKDPAQNLAGIAYIGSSDAAKNTAYTRGGNNYLPLIKN